VDFLVEIVIRLPVDFDPDRRVALLDAELARGSALAQAGVLRAIWRVPGQTANRGIWTAQDATALHDALISLPLWPYMDVSVTALAEHPLASVCPGIPGGSTVDVPRAAGLSSSPQPNLSGPC
jgi:muconolactone D-isomerase